MNTLYLYKFFGLHRISIPEFPCIGIQKHPKQTLRKYKKVSTRIIRVDTFNSSKLFT